MTKTITTELMITTIKFSEVGSDSEVPAESLPPPGNYLRHPNMYLPPYSIASETEAEDNGSIRQSLNEYEGPDDDPDDSPSSHSSFASQIRRPMALMCPLTGANRLSQGSFSDVSNLCEIEDSEYDEVDVRTNKQGHAIQTDVWMVLNWTPWHFPYSSSSAFFYLSLSYLFQCKKKKGRRTWSLCSLMNGL